LENLERGIRPVQGQGAMSGQEQRGEGEGFLEKFHGRDGVEGSIKIRATHKVVALGTAPLAFLVVQFVTVTRTPAPVSAHHQAGSAFRLRPASRKGTGVVLLFLFGGHADIFRQEASPINSG